MRGLDVVLDQDDDAIDFVLPHHGDAREDCGRLKFIGHDAGPKGLHFKRSRLDCRRYDCPTCRCELENGKVKVARGWEHRAAQSMEHRILEGMKYLGRLYPIHVVVSPPQDWAKNLVRTLKGFRKLCRAADVVVRKAGLQGGAVVFHPSRIPSRWNDRVGCSEGPHFHYLGAGWIIPAKPKGWVVVNLTTKKRSGKMESLYLTSLYVLSHCGRAVGQRRSSAAADPHMDQPKRAGGRSGSAGTHPSAPQALLDAGLSDDHGPASSSERGYPAIAQSTYFTNAVRWVGAMSYNRLKGVKLPRDDAYYCKICAADVPRLEWFGLSWSADPPDSDEGIAAPGTFTILPSRSEEIAQLRAEREAEAYVRDRPYLRRLAREMDADELFS